MYLCLYGSADLYDILYLCLEGRKTTIAKRMKSVILFKFFSSYANFIIHQLLINLKLRQFMYDIII